jgi:hypothetical protein
LSTAAAAEPAGGKWPGLGFVANDGRLDALLDPSVHGFTRSGGLTMFFTARGFLAQRVVQPDGAGPRGVNLAFTFAGVAHPQKVAVVPEGRREGVVSFFKGNDPARWATGLPTYDAVRYRGLYDGIDVVVHADRALEYDLLVRPGADPRRVRMKVEGARSLAIGAAGELIVDTDVGPLVHARPRTFALQKNGARREVEARFRLLDAATFGFDVAGWDGASPLVVDPSFAFATLVGGFDSDVLNAVTLVADGAPVMAGQTLSVNFPTTVGAFDPAFGGSGSGACDAMVVKTTPDGKALLYATFIGGTNGQTFIGEFATGIAPYAINDVVVVGATTATDFPTTPGAYQTVLKGPRDAFVLQLNAPGTALGWSTYLGGSGDDSAMAVAVDALDRVHVTGQTASIDFPFVGGFDAILSGTSPFDAFLASLDITGSHVTYATFMGGFGEESGFAVAASPDARVVVAGSTSSTNFPVFPGNLDVTHNGGADLFVVKVDPVNGGSPQIATYLGGSGDDVANGVAVDAGTSIYLTGRTTSANFPVVGSVFGATRKGVSDAFVTKVNASGTAIQFSALLGGTDPGGMETARAIALTDLGTIVLAGVTDSADFPAIGAGADGSLAGATDLFLAEVANDFSQLLYATVIGGGSSEDAYGVASLAGRSYAVGQTSSADFPATPGTFDTSFSGGFSDAVLVEYGDDCSGSIVEFGFGCPGEGGFVPRLTAAGCPVPGEPWQLRITNGVGGLTGFIFQGTGQEFVKISKECRLQIAPIVPNAVPITLGGAGAGNGSANIIGIFPDTPPAMINLQVFFMDPNSPGGIAASGTNPLRLNIGAP